VAVAGSVGAKTRLAIFGSLGPYPGEFLGLQEAIGHDAAMDAMKSGIDRAARLIEDHRAIAFGEVGRPHFPVSEEVWAASNRLLGYTMERAREHDCACVLHSEDPTPET